MSYIMFLRQLRHLLSSFSIFPSLSLGECDVSAQFERQKNFSVTHFYNFCREEMLNYHPKLCYPTQTTHGQKMQYLYSFLKDFPLIPRFRIFLIFRISPTVVRKGDLVKFDFEHAHCQRGPKYGLFYHCTCSYSLL